MPWGAAIGAVGSIVGGALAGGGSSGSQGIANNAVGTWTKELQSQLDLANSNTNPYIGTFNKALAPLAQNLQSYIKPFTPGDLTQTPGYQFTLNQGLKATQNSQTARGLGVSGAAIQAGDQYATGLADQTYNQQLQNYMAQNLQGYNMLTGMATTGLQGALQQGNQEVGAGSTMGGWGMQGAGLSGAYNAMGANSFAGGVTGAAGLMGAAMSPNGAGSSLSGGGFLGNAISSGYNALFGPATAPSSGGSAIDA